MKKLLPRPPTGLAVKLKVVDLIADSVPDLLAKRMRIKEGALMASRTPKMETTMSISSNRTLPRCAAAIPEVFLRIRSFLLQRLLNRAILI